MFQLLVLISIFGAFFFASLTPDAFAANKDAKDRTQPIISKARKADTSPSLRFLVEHETQLRVLRGPDKTIREEDIKLQVLPRDEQSRKNLDEGLLKRPYTGTEFAPLGPVVPLIPGPLGTFQGLTQMDNYNEYTSRFNPPDTVGDVGPGHYVQAVNNNFAVFSKAGAMLLGPARISTLFIGFGGACEFTDAGDPIVLYDPIADRWLISQFTTIVVAPNSQCIAISATSDPTGPYHRYEFAQPNVKFADYPKYGVWPDAYYMTANLFNGALNAFLGAGAYAYNRTKMLAGDPTAEMVYFDLQFFDDPVNGCTGTIGCPGGILPADLDGISLPATGDPGIFMMFTADEDGADPPNDQDALRIWEFSVDFVTPANSTFTERAESPLPVAAFDYVTPAGRNDIPQLGTLNRVDSIGDRLMHRLGYRNFGTHESLVVNHTVDVSGNPASAVYQAGVRYYEIRKTAGVYTVAEQGTFTGSPADATHRWMGSAAMDAAGNLAVGYSHSSAADFPSIRYAGRLAGDPAGSLAQGEATMFLGTSFLAFPASPSFQARWGDYSAMSVDPADECTFWYTNQYFDAASTQCPNNTGAGTNICWFTRIGSFNFGGGTCASPNNGTLDGTITDCDTAATIAGAGIEALDANNIAWNTTADGSGFYSRLLVPGTYDVTASAPGYSSGVSAGEVITGGNTTTVDLCLNAVGTADLEVTKSDDSDPLDLGVDTTLQYTITVTNNGPDDANNVTIIDTLPAGVTVNNITPSGAGICNQVANVITCGYLLIANGNSETITVDVTVANPVNIVNSVTVEATEFDPNHGDNTAVETTEVVRYPAGCGPTGQATFNSADTPLPIPDAGFVTSTITVAGADPFLWDVDILTSITHGLSGDLEITVTSPAGTIVTLTTDNGTAKDNIFDGTLWDDDGGDFNPPGPVTDNFVDNNITETPLTVEEALGAFFGEDPNGNWTITVTDDFATNTGTLNGWTLVLHTYASAPNMEEATYANPTPTPLVDAGTLTSQITVAGAGHTIANLRMQTFITHTWSNDLDITLTSPSGTTVTITTDNGGDLNHVFNGTVWRDDAGDTNAPGAPSDTTYANNVVETPLTPEEAMGAFRGEDPNGTWTLSITDDTAVDTGMLNGWSLTFVTATCETPDLIVTKTDVTDPVFALQNVDYTITVDANGAWDDATGVIVTDTLPANTNLVFATPSQGSCGPPVAGVLTCWLGDITAGNSATVTVTVQTTVPGLITNAACAESAEADVVPGDNCDTEDTDVLQSSDLAITKTDSPDPFVVGSGDLVYTVTVTNNGPFGNTGVQVTDILPSTATFVSAVPSQGVCAELGGIVNCSLGLMNVGDSATIIITVTPGSQVMGIENYASVTGLQPDPDPTNNQVIQRTGIYADTVPAAPTQCTATTSGYFHTMADTIPNDGSPLMSTLDVTGAGDYVWDLDLLTFVDQICNSGLDITLTSPAGTQVTISTQNIACTSVLNGTIWDDQVNNPITDVSLFSNPLSPVTVEEALSAFNGEDPNGTWTLTVVDTSNNGGFLQEWALRLTTLSSAPNEVVRSYSNYNSMELMPVGTFVSTIDVTGAVAISDIDMILNLTHFDASDNIITLTSPAGTEVVLSSFNGTLNSFQGTLWNDSGDTPATDAFYNPGFAVTPLVPESAMGAFTGEDPNGTWTLTITDVDLDILEVLWGLPYPNRLNNWSLDITGASCGEADLTLTKSDDPDPVQEGDSLHYIIEVTNNGPDDATGVQVLDTLPNGAVFVSATAGCSYASGTVTCNLASLASGDTATFDIYVDPSLSGIITNTACVSAYESDANGADNCDSEDTSVQLNAPGFTDLELTKTDTVDPVFGTSTFTYLLTVTNAGPDISSGFTLTDTLSNDTTFDSASPECVHDGSLTGGVVTCVYNGDIANGASVSLMVNVTAADVLVQTIATNSACVVADNADVVAANDCDSEDTTIDPAPAPSNADLEITKVDTFDPLQVGSLVTYVLSITNNGPDTATQVTVTDTLHPSTTFQSASPGCLYDSNTHTVTCSIASMANGVTVQFQIQVGTTLAGLVTNTACVSAFNNNDGNGANDCDSEGTTITITPPTLTDLTLTKTASATSVLAGNNITYTLVVFNDGPNISNGHTVIDTLPVEVQFVSASAGCSHNGVNPGGVVTCQFGPLGNNSSTQYTILVKAVSDPLAVNNACVTGDDFDLFNVNDCDDATTTITPTSVDLSLVKTGSPTSTTVGGTIDYTLTITNNGPDASTGSTLVDTLPGEVQFLSASPGCVHVAGVVTCSIGALTNGNSTSVTIQVEVVATGTLLNTATVTGNDADTNTANNTDTETTTASQCVFCDDFEDSTLQPAGVWTYTPSITGWSEDGDNLVGQSTGKILAVATPIFAGCQVCSFETSMSTAGGTGNTIWFLPWHVNVQNTMELLMKQEKGKWILKQRVNNTIVKKASFKSPINVGQFYNVKITFNGSTFLVDIGGTTSAITMVPAAAVPTGTVGYRIKGTTGRIAFINVN